MTDRLHRQYGRSARVTVIGQAGQVVINPVLPEIGVSVPNQTHVSFTVTKSVGIEPDRATISVTHADVARLDPILGNIRSPSWVFARPEFERSFDAFGGASPVLNTTALGHAWVRLEAGYRSSPPVLFEGQCDHIVTVGGVTTFASADAVLELTAAHADRSFGRTTALEVVRYLASRAGLSLARTSALAALQRDVALGGVYAHGRVSDLLRDMLDGDEWDVWVSDGQLWVTPKGEPIRGGPPPVLAGGPVPGAYQMLTEPEAVDGGGILVRTLLAPAVRAGFEVAVRASQAAGTYRVEHVMHTGDNRGQGDSITEAILREPGALLPY